MLQRVTFANQIFIFPEVFACFLFHGGNLFFQSFYRRTHIVQFVLQLFLFLVEQCDHVCLSCIFFTGFSKEFFQIFDFLFIFCDFIQKIFAFNFGEFPLLSLGRDGRIFAQFLIFFFCFAQLFFQFRHLDPHLKLIRFDHTQFGLIPFRFRKIFCDIRFRFCQKFFRFFIQFDFFRFFQFHLQNTVFLQNGFQQCLIAHGAFIFFRAAFVIRDRGLQILFFFIERSFFRFQHQDRFPEFPQFFSGGGCGRSQFLQFCNFFLRRIQFGLCIFQCFFEFRPFIQFCICNDFFSGCKFIPHIFQCGFEFFAFSQFCICNDFLCCCKFFFRIGEFFGESCFFRLQLRQFFFQWFHRLGTCFFLSQIGRKFIDLLIPVCDQFRLCLHCQFKTLDFFLCLTEQRILIGQSFYFRFCFFQGFFRLLQSIFQLNGFFFRGGIIQLQFFAGIDQIIIFGHDRIQADPRLCQFRFCAGSGCGRSLGKLLCKKIAFFPQSGCFGTKLDKFILCSFDVFPVFVQFLPGVFKLSGQSIIAVPQIFDHILRPCQIAGTFRQNFFLIFHIGIEAFDLFLQFIIFCAECCYILFQQSCRLIQIQIAAEFGQGFIGIVGSFGFFRQFRGKTPDFSVQFFLICLCQFAALAQFFPEGIDFFFQFFCALIPFFEFSIGFLKFGIADGKFLQFSLCRSDFLLQFFQQCIQLICTLFFFCQSRLKQLIILCGIARLFRFVQLKKKNGIFLFHFCFFVQKFFHQFRCLDRLRNFLFVERTLLFQVFQLHLQFGDLLDGVCIGICDLLIQRAGRFLCGTAFFRKLNFPFNGADTAGNTCGIPVRLFPLDFTEHFRCPFVKSHSIDIFSIAECGIRFFCGENTHTPRVPVFIGKLTGGGRCGILCGKNLIRQNRSGSSSHQGGKDQRFIIQHHFFNS